MCLFTGFFLDTLYTSLSPSGALRHNGLPVGPSPQKEHTYHTMLWGHLNSSTLEFRLFRLPLKIVQHSWTGFHSEKHMVGRIVARPSIQLGWTLAATDTTEGGRAWNWPPGALLTGEMLCYVLFITREFICLHCSLWRLVRYWGKLCAKKKLYKGVSARGEYRRNPYVELFICLVFHADHSLTSDAASLSFPGPSLCARNFSRIFFIFFSFSFHFLLRETSFSGFAQAATKSWPARIRTPDI